MFVLGDDLEVFFDVIWFVVVDCDDDIVGYVGFFRRGCFVCDM